MAGLGEAPNVSPSRSIGKGGLPMRKKVMPKREPAKLKEKVGWKKSFGIYKTKKG